jgi:hypothetical protein
MGLAGLADPELPTLKCAPDVDPNSSLLAKPPQRPAVPHRVGGASAVATGGLPARGHIQGT